MAIIEVEHLQKRYGETLAVDDVSLAIEEGEIFGILGPNGAGKTTSVECISGLREPDGGSISVLGLDPRSQRDEVQRVLGMQLQESDLPEKLKVGEALDLYASFYEHPADPAELLELLGLTGKRETRFAKPSGGQKQRLSIALALIGKPRGRDRHARESRRRCGRAPANPLSSERELEVLTLVARGASNREAAAQLLISEATVKTHLLHIYAKLGVNDRAAAVTEAFNRGLLTPEKR